MKRSVAYLLFSSFLSSFVTARRAVVEERALAPVDPTDTDYGALYGKCPEDNAVCVVIRMRNPKASDFCKENCQGIASRLTTNLRPHQDDSFPEGCGRCVAVDTSVGGRDVTKHWAFDVVFPYDDLSQEAIPNMDVFHTVVEPTVDEAFGRDGGACKSAALFAYGASGSGKSFTMGFEPGKTDGLLQLGADRMFQNLKLLKAKGHVLGNQQVFMAYYEIYRERVFDLLAKKRGKGEKGSYNVVTTALSFKPIDSLDSMMAVFTKGNKNRVVASTGMNEVSSRSHAIVQLVISADPLGTMAKKIAGGDKQQRTPLLKALSKSTQVTFVDLAGSEPAAKSSDPTTQAEGKAINQALTSLRSCIAAAADPKKPACSTRSNMLTEMLQNLFAVDRKTKKGKAFTRMIATVNPSADPLQVSHTKSTMTYASTVKSIKIEAPQGQKIEDRVQVLPEQTIAELKAKVASLEARNQDLESELLKYKTGEMPVPAKEASTGQKCDDVELEDLKSKLETKTGEVQKLTHDLESQKQSLQEAMDLAHNDLLEQKQELGLCNTLLGSTEASRTLLEEQNQQLLDSEASQLQTMDSLKTQLAECTNKGQQQEQTLAMQEEQKLQKQQQACKLLNISSAIKEDWEGKSNLETVLQEVASINVKQAERKELLEKLSEQRLKAGKVTFSAWLGQLVSDLRGDGEELGPVQKRLLKVDKAIEIVKEGEAQDAQILVSLHDAARDILTLHEDKLNSQYNNIANMSKGESFAEVILNALRNMQERLGGIKTTFTDDAERAAALIEEMDKQTVRSLCFSRRLFSQRANGTCPDLEHQHSDCI